MFNSNLVQAKADEIKGEEKFQKEMAIRFHRTVNFIFLFYFQNNSIVTSEYKVRSYKLPESFNGFKIVQLSDLHNKSFRNDQSYLVEKVKKLRPDLIVFTGDLIDSNKYDEEPALMLMERLIQVAPIFLCYRESRMVVRGIPFIRR